MDFHRFSISMLVWWRLLACFVRRMSCDPSARLNADQCTSGFAAGLTGPCEWTSPNGRNCRWSLQMLSLQKHIGSKLDTPEIQITRKWDKLRSNVAPWGSPVLKGKICVPKWFQISVVQVAIFSIMATTSRCSIHVATYLCVDLYLNAVSLSMHIYNIRIHCVYHIAMLCAYIYIYTYIPYIHICRITYAYVKV